MTCYTEVMGWTPVGKKCHDALNLGWHKSHRAFLSILQKDPYGQRSLGSLKLLRGTSKFFDAYPLSFSGFAFLHISRILI